MRDDDVDLLLDRARPDASGPSSELARLASVATVRERAGRRSGWRPGWRRSGRARWWRAGVLVPVGVGALAITGAGTYAAYQLSVPPFVSTDVGVERVTHPISVDYTTDAGTRLRCNLWLEFRDVTPRQRDGLDAMSSDPRWAGFGQEVYDALPSPNRRVQDGPERLWSDRVDARVYADALRAAPGLVFRGPSGSASLEGSTTRCDYPDRDR